MEKNRTLENQLSNLRVKLQNIEKESVQYQQQVLSLEESLSDQKEVNRKLEHAVNEALKVRKSSNTGEGSLEKPSDVSDQRMSEEQSILGIVCQQRDRYKQKMLEYEVACCSKIHFVF
jgi:phage shock protein A